jgi:anti-anti-sigma factor
MTESTVDVVTGADGSLIVRPHGVLGAEDAVELRHTLVHAVRRLRPMRLILDMRDVRDLDSINVGTLAAACHLGDDHQVAVFLDNPSLTIAGRLAAAGIAGHRLRHVSTARTAGDGTHQEDLPDHPVGAPAG